MTEHGQSLPAGWALFGRSMALRVATMRYLATWLPGYLATWLPGYLQSSHRSVPSAKPMLSI